MITMKFNTLQNQEADLPPQVAAAISGEPWEDDFLAVWKMTDLNKYNHFLYRTKVGGKDVEIFSGAFIEVKIRE